MPFTKVKKDVMFMPRRRGRRRLSGSVITNAIHIEYDQIKEEFSPIKDKQWLRNYFDAEYFKNDWNACRIYTELKFRPH